MKRADRPALFLDRDGTINEDSGYLDHPDRVVLLPGAAAAIAQARALGFLVIVISNQSGVGRGYFDASVVDDVNARVVTRLAEAHPEARLDGIYWCPHRPPVARRVGCACRKPHPGLLIEAQRVHGLDLGASWMVGDKPSDVGAGRNAGTRTVLLAPPSTPGDATLVVVDLAAAVAGIAAIIEVESAVESKESI